jgi:hypothetical protein
MVRKAAFLPAVLLLLSACQFFAASQFPGYLAQTEIGIDLSDQVDTLLAGRTNPLRGDLFILSNAAGEDFACLLLIVDYTADRALFVLTPDGRLLQRSEPELNRLHLIDEGDNFVVGRVAYDSTSFSLLSTTTMLSEDSWKPGFSYGTDYFVFDANWSNTLNYYQYGSGWSGRSAVLSLSLSTSTSYELTRVFKDTDPSAAGAEVILVLRTSGGNGESAVVVRTPQTEYPGAALIQPIVDNYPHTIISEDNLDPGRTYYTRKGIAAASHDGQATLYSFGGSKISSLALGQRKELLLAFNLEGTQFYCFNLDDRLFFKGKTGW